MKRTFGAVVMMLTVLWAVPAMAQTAPAPPPPADEMRWYAGLNFGTAVVEKFSGAFGFDAGVRVRPGFDVVGEVSWAGNVVTRRQLDNVNKLANSIATSQNGASDGSLKAPMRYAGLGIRYVFEQESRLEPYVMATIGGARTKLEPTLTLRGTDVTSSVAQYGVTLGRDVIGVSNDFASELSVGVLLRQGTWYGDASARLTSVSAENQRINVARLVIGGGYRF